jgi:hypothetical protein
MTLNKGQLLLLLALIIGAALRIPGWFTEEEMRRYRLYEVDEEQHMSISMKRYNEFKGGLKDTIQHDFHDGDYNVRGYGHLTAAVAFVWNQYTQMTPRFPDMLKLGRQLSTFFALLLIVVVYRMGLRSGLDPPFAGVAALLMACCDVNATYAHYMLPASGYVLFAWTAMLGGVRLLHGPSWRALILLAFGASGAIAFKFDVFPMVWGGLLLIVLTLRGGGKEKPAHLGLPWPYLVVGSLLIPAILYVWWLGWTWEEIVHSFEALRLVNGDTIAREDHWRDNLITYPFGVLAGIGLPAFGLAAWTMVGVIRRRFRESDTFWTVKNLTAAYIFAYLFTEFFLRWSMDTTFIRRVNVFMPAVALLAAYGLQRLKAGPWLVTAVIAWSFGLALVGQSNHWFDNRMEMREWANKELPKPKKVGITAYALIRNLDNWTYYLDADWDYLITHESYFRRFTHRSMTTPFGTPECCWMVHHCGDEDRCEDVQSMHLGTHKGVRLIKRFRPRDYFPERLIYRHFFGYYETFLGDIEVYERIAPPENERTTS